MHKTTYLYIGVYGECSDVYLRVAHILINRNRNSILKVARIYGERLVRAIIDRLRVRYQRVN